VGGSSIINRAAALNSQQQQQQQHAKPSMDEQQQRRRRSKRKDSIIGNNRSTTATDETTIIDTVGTVSPTTNTTLHIIFSTDCSTYQQWQSYLFFYSAYTVGQPGYITRIVSGCNDDDDDSSSSSSKKKKTKEDKERQWHNIHIRQVMSDRYRIHFTPKFSTVKEYNEDGGDGGGGGGGSSKGKEYKY
jgi:hypothetical protein